MKIVQVEQGTQEWLDWRAQGVSASDMATVLGMNEHETRFKLWSVKRGLCEPDDLSRNPHVRRGKAMEPVLRQMTNAATQDALVSYCVESDRQPLIRASLDGLDAQGRPREFKCPSAKRYGEAKACFEASKIRRLYYPQVQAQIFCTDASEAVLTLGLFERGPGWDEYILVEPPVDFVIQRDEAFIERMVAEAEAFWALVVNGTAPDLDPERDLWFPETPVERALWAKSAQELHDLLEEEKRIKARLDQIGEEKKKPYSRLKNLLGGRKKGEWGGLRFMRTTRVGAVDYNNLLKAHDIDPTKELLDRFRKEGTTDYKAVLISDD